nr:RNA-directed DNA polymerase, eukaryota, reverse transcriptase zinc-binding domain protein [Tanacetum cinerariifolium]
MSCSYSNLPRRTPVGLLMSSITMTNGMACWAEEVSLKPATSNRSASEAMGTDLVSNTQSAFISGRKILDGPFILDEILNWCKRKKKQALFFNFAKAYDFIRLFKGIQLSGSLSVSHLFYADDAMFLGEWPERNLSGSQFYWLFYHAQSISILRSEVNTLSAGGRLTLLKSVLGASPIYSMSIFKVPRGVLKTMEAIRNRFFIGADQLERKLTWIAWDKVLASKKNRGLGVSSFFALNRALLLKWVWRFVSCDDSLWCQVVRAMYGDMIESHPTHISSIWCSILRELHVLKGKGFDFWSHCKKRIENGSDTRFWLDCWTGDSPFYIHFPRLFALELDKNISVANKMLSETNHSFRRPIRDGHERNQMNDLQVLLDMVSLSQSRDRWLCDLTGNGDFRVKESWFDSIRLTSKSRSLLKGIFYVAWWAIWNLRNRAIFEGITPRRSLIFDDIVLLAFNWCHSRYCTGRLGISSLLKCTSAIRQLAYNTVPDALDGYLQMSQATSCLSLEHFCRFVMEIIGPEYLRRPTISEKNGLLRMLGSLDYTDSEWFGCPIAYKVQYCRRDFSPNPFNLLELKGKKEYFHTISEEYECRTGVNGCCNWETHNAVITTTYICYSVVVVTEKGDKWEEVMVQEEKNGIALPNDAAVQILEVSTHNQIKSPICVGKGSITAELKYELLKLHVFATETSSSFQVTGLLNNMQLHAQQTA